MFASKAPRKELSEFKDKEKVNLYLSKYLHFYQRFAGKQRDIDKALHTFGTFLEEWPGLYS